MANERNTNSSIFKGVLIRKNCLTKFISRQQTNAMKDPQHISHLNVYLKEIELQATDTVRYIDYTR